MNPITLNNLNSLSQLRELISVFSLAFEMEYSVDDTYLENLLQNKDAIILGVLLENKVVGGLVAFEMTPIHGAKELYIYDIAIHPEHQRQGLGKQLIKQLKDTAKSNGVKTIFVEAESEDEGAVAFYRALGGEEVAVHHFNFNL
jgi:aminoglycoside 3-N-acetyltransferase I